MVNLFVRALVIATIIAAVTDAIMFYAIWSGKTQITPLFVILAIIITMVPIAINLWFTFSSSLARQVQRSSLAYGGD